MAGATVTIDDAALLESLREIQARGDDTETPLRSIGEALIISHRARAKEEISPEGAKWAPLSPAYKKRKKKHKNRILLLDDHLIAELHYAVDATGLAFGTDSVYGAIHQFGGSIEHKARTQELYFRQNERTKEVGNRFVKRDKSNFAQTVNVKAYTARVPARPYLGMSKADVEEAREILSDWVLEK